LFHCRRFSLIANFSIAQKRDERSIVPIETFSAFALDPVAAGPLFNQNATLWIGTSLGFGEGKRFGPIANAAPDIEVVEALPMRITLNVKGMVSAKVKDVCCLDGLHTHETYFRVVFLFSRHSFLAVWKMTRVYDGADFVADNQYLEVNSH